MKSTETFSTVENAAVTRCRQLMRGVMLLETNRGAETLAVYAPIWEGDLTDSTKALAQVPTGTTPMACGYAFCEARDCCLPAFELWQVTEAIHPHIDYRRLMAAIWRYHPEYAAAWNLREQLGTSDPVVQILKKLGISVEASNAPKQLISIQSDGEGSIFLL